MFFSNPIFEPCAVSRLGTCQSSSIERGIRVRKRGNEYTRENGTEEETREKGMTSVSIKMSTGDKVCSTKRRRRGFHYLLPSPFLHDEFSPVCKLSEVLRCVFLSVLQDSLMAFTTGNSHNSIARG